MTERGISRLDTVTTVRKCSGTSTMLWYKSKVSSIFKTCVNTSHALWVESVFSCFVWCLEDKKVSKFLTHLLNKADCEWGPWIPGRKCSKRQGKRRDTRDMIQGAMYGGKPCRGKHYRIVPCKGKYIISKSCDYHISNSWMYFKEMY